MTYNTLETAARRAVCRTLGSKSQNFDKWLVSCDPNGYIKIEELDLGTSVEIAFEPSISPVAYFSSDVVFFVNLSTNGLGDVQAFFGNACSDVVSAEAAAKEFLSRDEADGWYIEDAFNDDVGLHLIHRFCCDHNDEISAEDAIASCFAELLENQTADKLRSFIHYFED